MFVELLGEVPEAKILDYLLLHPHLGHTLTNITEGAELNFRTTKKKMNMLVALGAVDSSEDGSRSYFRINHTTLLKEFKKLDRLWGE